MIAKKVETRLPILLHSKREKQKLLPPINFKVATLSNTTTEQQKKKLWCPDVGKSQISIANIFHKI